MQKPSVSVHAVLRWLERAEGVDVRAFRNDLASIEEVHPDEVKPYDLETWILAAYQWPREKVIDEMLTPAVVAAFNAGCARVKTRGVLLCFTGSTVITVLPGCKQVKAERPGGLPAHQKNRNRRRRRTVKGGW